MENKRTFPPLYVQTGDISKDRLGFIHILQRLKVKKKKKKTDLILRELNKLN